jgi:mono/diheme cytochrome c family protein
MAASPSDPETPVSGSEGLLYVGFGAMVSFIVVLVLGLAVTAAGLTNSSGPRLASGDAATDGAQIFEQHCAACHGADGRGKVGPSLHGVAEKYVAFESQTLVVAQGRGAMPSFRSTLSNDQIDAVVTFERETFTDSESNDDELEG